MKTTSHVELSFSQMLVAWAAQHIAPVTTAIKPAHSAGQIAALVAAGSSPTGA